VPVPAGPGNALASPNTGGEYSFNSTDGGKQLQTVDARLKAIDIPLGLVYKVNKHYYTSAGISYFNVLSEKRSNTYSQTQSVSKTSTDPATGIAFAYRVLETQEIDEPAPNQPFLTFLSDAVRIFLNNIISRLSLLLKFLSGNFLHRT
jgi:hypothetical protein